MITVFQEVCCTVCGADKPETILEDLIVKNHPAQRVCIVRCGACGVLYTNPRPRPEVINRFYNDDYYDLLEARQPPLEPGPIERCFRLGLAHHFGYPSPPSTRWWSGALLWPLSLRLRYHHRHLDAIPWVGEGRLLDFGCGNCGFLKKQRGRGWEVCGIDFSRAVAERARKLDGLDVVVGTWPGHALSDRIFDVITIWHTLEHLPDPVGWIRQAATQLAPGGYLLICSPVVDSWGFRIFGKDWVGLDVPRHFSHFTRGLLVSLLREAGLKVVRVRPQVRSATLLESAANRSEKRGSAFWKWISRRKFLWSVAATLSGWVGRADGILVTARKPGTPSLE